MSAPVLFNSFVLQSVWCLVTCMGHPDQASLLSESMASVEEQARYEDRIVGLIDLAGHQVGGIVLYASTEFFAEAKNLLQPGRGKFDPDVFSLNGKVMDGWETARHSVLNESRGGRDFCIIKLGIPGLIDLVDIDTLWFIGNPPESAMLEATFAPAEASWIELHLSSEWTTIVPQAPLVPGTEDKGHNFFESLEPQRRFTHVRLTMFPDGGISRLRIFGRPAPDLDWLRSLGVAADLACVVNGGKVLDASNMFYSHPANLLLPNQAKNMGDGWETRRSRQPNHEDWVIIELGTPGLLYAIEIDTSHFRGNFPHRFCIYTALCSDSEMADSFKWDLAIPATEGKPHSRMLLIPEKDKAVRISHVKLAIIPDGGVSRLRVLCKSF